MSANLSPGCSVKPAIQAKPKTVSVNGVAISRAAIARETQNHPAAKPIQAWQAAATALAIRELLLQEACRQGLCPEPIGDGEGRRETDEEALVRQVLEREVRTPEPDDATCRRYWETNRHRFRSSDLCDVAHILLPCQDKARANETELKAHALLSALRGDPGAFAALAKIHSACPSRETGGSLGQIGPGQTVPEFEKGLSSLAVGEHGLIRTRYGLHIVRIERRIEGRDLPFEIVSPLIASFLRDRVRQVAERQYVMLLAGRADIQGVAIEAASSPLMQ